MAARDMRRGVLPVLDSGACLHGSRCKFQHVQNLQFTPTTALSFPVYRNVKAGDKSEKDDENNDPPLERFFARFSLSGFSYNPERPVIKEFNRLCHTLDLEPNDKDNPRVLEIRSGLKDAMVLQFNSKYGTDVNSITSWQGLCRVLGISPVPTTLDKCKSVVTNTHVNLVDLVDAGGTRIVPKFPSEKALSKYTLETRKIFPRENVHAGGLLKALLRRIRHPPDAPKQQGSARKTRQKRSKAHRRRHKGSLRVGTLEPATDRRHTTTRRKAFLVAKSRLEDRVFRG